MHRRSFIAAAAAALAGCIVGCPSKQIGYDIGVDPGSEEGSSSQTFTWRGRTYNKDDWECSPDGNAVFSRRLQKVEVVVQGRGLQEAEEIRAEFQALRDRDIISQQTMVEHDDICSKAIQVIEDRMMEKIREERFDMIARAIG